MRISRTPIQMATDLHAELTYSFARSGGKGGQNVNKVETKVLLRFDVEASVLLTQFQKERIREKCANQINQDGIFQISCEETRSQLKNKEIVTKRFHNLIETALKPPKRRKKTRVPRSVKEKRLKDKRLKSQKKQDRRKGVWE